MAERRVLDYFRKLAAPDGTLAKDQMVAAFSSLGLGKLSPDELEDGIAKSGLNNNGRIHIDTFIRWLWREDSTDDDPGSPLPRAKRGLPLILISDPGQDLDDEMTYIMLRYLVHRRIADVRGIITTLTPAFDRARLCRGTLDTLGLYSVPIGVGTDGGDTAGVHKAATFEMWAHTYMPTMHSRSSSTFEPGNRLLCRLYEEAEPKSLTLVIISSLKDAAVFLRDNEALFVEKTSEVVIMGGVKPFESQHWAVRLEPDTAHNNEFDSAAASFFYRRCQEVGVRLIVVSRFAAYAAKVPRSCYDDLAAMGSSVGCRLRNAQRASIQALWSRACAEGAARQGLPARCDQQWFLKTFCGGARETNRSGSDTIWDIVDSFMQYDTLALLTAFPQIRSEYFAPIEVNGLGGVKHLVIGCSEDCPSVSKPVELAQLLNTGFSKGLALGHRQKLQFIFILSPRWNNRADELVSLLFLRALYELGIVDCAGIIISPARNTTRPNQDFQEAAIEIRETLAEVGMAHVPVHVATAYSEDDVIDPPQFVREKSVDFDSKFMTGARLLSDLYDQAPPAGITLVVECSLGDVAKFVHDHPKKFHERTQAVVLVGGALVEVDGDSRRNGSLSSAGPTLVPDPTAQNNSLDMPAAESFFKAAQHHLVPLIVLSRYYAQAVNVPRKLFDALASHGGKIGIKVCAAQRKSMEALWSAVRADPSEKHLRRQLPERCDRNWFIKTFCPNGPPQDDDDIWSAIGHFNLYSPLALMAVVPSITNRVTKGTEVVVRSVRHTLIGVNSESTGLLEEDSARLKCILYQCLFTGARLNLSEFDLSLPPAIPLGSASAGENSEWKYNPNHHALDWLLNDRRWSKEC